MMAPSSREKPKRSNEAWVLDVAGTIVYGQRFSVLGVVDLYSHECLAAEVQANLSAGDVVRVLRHLAVERGARRRLLADGDRIFTETKMIRATDDSVTLIGKLGSAPEIKPVAIGQMLTLSLGVRVVSCAIDEDGQRQSTEKTSWHRVVSFDPRVIRCAQGLERDDTIAVRGYLEHRRYDKDGQRLFITEFVAEELDPIRTMRLRLAVPSPPPVDARTSQRADMLRITIELLPGGHERGAMVISRGALPITDLAGLAKATGGVDG